MQGAKTGPGHHYRGVGAGGEANMGHYFVPHIVVPLVLPNGFVRPLHGFIHPALVVQAVDAVHFALAGVDVWRKRVNQLKALVFEIIGGGGGYQQQCKAVVAITYNGHVLVHGRAVPAKIYFFHTVSLVMQ